jgi:hypothetical protein
MIDSVYISGPITGMKNNNFDEFDKAYNLLRKTIPIVKNPLKITDFMPISSIHSDYMKMCLKELIFSSAIYMLHGWWHSRGAIVELIVAKACGLKIMWEK